MVEWVQSFQQQDRQLTAAMRSGDSDAFEALYRLHLPHARRWASKFVHERDDVEDVVSESFTRVFAVLRDGRGPELALGPYLISTLRNVSISRARQLNRNVTVEEIEPLLEMKTAFDAACGDSLMIESFNGLEPRRQMVFWLRSVEGLSGGEIAAVLGMSVSAVNVHYHRAKKDLQRGYLARFAEGALPLGHLVTTEQLLSWNSSVTQSPSRSQEVPEGDWIATHVANCDRCKRVLVEKTGIERRFRVLIPLLPAAALLRITVKDPPRAETSRVAAVAAAGMLVAAGIGSAIYAGVTSTAVQAPSATVYEGDDCGVRFVGAGHGSPTRFEVDPAPGSGGCAVTVVFQGRELGMVHADEQRAILLAPRTGNYTISVVPGSGGSAERMSFEAR